MRTLLATALGLASCGRTEEIAPDCEPVAWYADSDADGYGDDATESFACEARAGTVREGGDCDDGVRSVNPSAVEICDGTDNDCDGTVDAGAFDAETWYADADDDGWGDEQVPVEGCDAPVGTVADATDCDDHDDDIHPEADEDDCTDPIDYNCDGSSGFADLDGDGFAACEDCDDRVATTHPGADETCDGSDDDCDGEIDEDATDPTAWYVDADGDGYGDASVALVACDAPEGHVADGTDCDDDDVVTHPGADEPDCTDAHDYNCDGSVGYADADGDGVPACLDCDDDDAETRPDGVEVCDGGDDDCDGAVDEDDATDATPWYADVDGDGYGDDADSVAACAAPAGYVAVAGDCDDTDATSHPGGTDACTDPVDHDCDGVVVFADVDGDGWAACEDCDDADAGAFPGATESCNGVDDDCDGALDEADAIDASTWYYDADGDGHGESSPTAVTCDAPAGYAALADDCDAADATRFPGAPELCDAQQNDCAGADWDAADEDGTVSAEDAVGAWTDLTASYTAGTAASPTTVTLPPGGTVWFCEGTYYVLLTASVGSVTLQGRAGAAGTVLDGADTGSVVTVPARAVVAIEGLTLQHGAGTTRSSDSYGGAVYASSGDVSLLDSVLTGNAAEYGAGVYVRDATLVVESTELSDNTATRGGGVYAEAATVTLADSEVDGNTATYGSGLYYSSTTGAGLSVTATAFSTNAATYGGGIYASSTSSGSVDVDACTFDGNVASGQGAGVYVSLAGSSSAAIARSTLSDNIAGTYGGGLYATMASASGLTLETTTFDANVAFSYGGGAAIFATTAADTSVADSAFSANESGGYGGGLYLSSSSVYGIDVESSTFSGNEAETRGAGLYLASNYADLVDVTVSDNTVTYPSSGGLGAGLYLDVDYGATIEGSAITGNGFSFTGASTYGGGFYATSCAVDLADTDVSGNTAYYGGGIYANGAGAAVSLDAASVVSDNHATNGGGVYVYSSAAVTCTGSSTATAGIFRNVASGVGGGIYVGSSSARATGSACDTGTGVDDNVQGTSSTSSDVYLSPTLYTYGDDATFACTGSSCT